MSTDFQSKKVLISSKWQFLLLMKYQIIILAEIFLLNLTFQAD